jgi:MFS family permease
MAGVGALLTAIQFSYWAVLVYLPLFLGAGLMVSIEMAGMALLAATLPMLLVPLIGGRFVMQLGWRRFFVVAFGIIAAGDALLLFATVAPNPAACFTASIAGMLAIGVGAALANPQMSSVVLALAPPTQAGMASAVTLIVRQAGFAISIAALGATLSKTDKAEAFAPPFALAVFAALVAIMTALVLLPGRSSQNDRSG